MTDITNMTDMLMTDQIRTRDPYMPLLPAPHTMPIIHIGLGHSTWSWARKKPLLRVASLEEMSSPPKKIDVC